MKRRKLILLSLLLLFSGAIKAQTREIIETIHTTNGWYVGVQGGTLLGVNTFTSFGADKTRMGLGLSAFGGYRFSSVLSVEASLQTGSATLAVRKGDVAANYWLGDDVIRYYAPVIDAKGWDYNNLTSRVRLHKMGVQGNFNLLGLLLPETARVRWELSPALSLMQTQADFSTIDAKQTVMSHKAQWCWGVGGSTQVSYRISRHLETGVYGGFTHLSGNYDRLPKHIHKTSNLYECGMKLTWAFGKDKKKISRVDLPVMPVAEIAQPDAVQTSRDAEDEPVIVSRENDMEEAFVTLNVKEDTLSFPVIYFAFNRSRIEKGEEVKLQEILRVLQDNLEVNVLITGWCDTVGSDAYNLPLSVRRANAVKTWLTARGISAYRIQTQGKGRDFKEKRADKARRSEIKEIKGK